MSDNQNRIDELMKKLDLLINQQSTFSKSIDVLKEEIQRLDQSTSEKPSEHIIEPVTETPTPEEVAPIKMWPDSVDLSEIKKIIKTYEEGKTSGGNEYVQFTIQKNNVSYLAFFSSNGNWMVKDMKGEMISIGRFKDDGKVLSPTKGQFADKHYRRNDLIENLIDAAGLSELNVSTKDKAKEIADRKEVATNHGVEEVSVKEVKPKTKSDIERYIGENIITVIGIVIVLIGVVFGVKYSIDHDLISPLMRVLLSYLLGVGILVTGMKLKKKYEQFSAVLVSGAMAIMYFVTYSAYSLYGLFPKLATFVIMVIFTIFTVVAAISYNRQIIAHIGLVGSYAVPFLLSDGSGNILALFIYMTILNCGILVIAFKKNWKPLYYVAFGVTWLIYFLWFADGYRQNEHFTIALLFALVFFLMFYCTFLIYKLIEKEKFEQEDVMMIVLNSAIFYGFSFVILDQHSIGRDYVGLFTVGTAIIHFIVSIILFKSKLADRNLFYLSSGMVLVFITIAVPVQLDGNWVTLLWGTEGALLFWIGRTKEVRFYEVLSYTVMGIALISLVDDYGHAYNYYYVQQLSAFKNTMFMTTAILSAAYGYILYLNTREKYSVKLRETNPDVLKFLTVALSVVVIGLVYNMFRMEFDIYGNYLFKATKTESGLNGWGDISYVYDWDIKRFKGLWIFNYSLFFAAGLALLNIKRIKNPAFGLVCLILNSLLVLFFLVGGLFGLSDLRESYISQPNGEFFTYSFYNIGMRYISYVFLAGSLYSIYSIVKSQYAENKEVKMVFDLLKHTVFLWILSSELINIMDLAGSNGGYKLELSILAGLYAILMVSLGIWKRKQYLRIAAISLFGVTLIKLFLYDMARSTTIAKTVVFISLGIILLIISFLYNKYKHLIIDEKE